MKTTRNLARTLKDCTIASISGTSIGLALTTVGCRRYYYLVNKTKFSHKD